MNAKFSKLVIKQLSVSKKKLFFIIMLLFIFGLFRINSFLRKPNSVSFIYRPLRNFTETCLKSCSCRLKFTDEKIMCNQVNLNDPDIKYIRNFPGLVCQQNFRNLADNLFWWRDYKYGENLAYEDYRLIKSCLWDQSIFYVNSINLQSFFEVFYPLVDHNFILITGASVVSVPNQNQMVTKILS
jgi:hypothetical protein